eukprot:Ihof_evm1s345 gene=Ihof_evmTU1s345
MVDNYGFLAIPKKDGDIVDYKAGLRQFIHENYDEPPGTYDAALEMITQWKTAANAAETHENGLNALSKYYCQVIKLAEKFPITGQSAIRITFSYGDSLRGGRKQKSGEIYYEAACVMYNYAATMSQMGSSITLDDSGCKAACSHFQGAAGAFAYIRDHLHGKFPMSVQPDLTVDCLSALSTLCLAQAQECFLHKAILGRMKEGVLSRLAAQASDYYGTVRVAMESSALRGMFQKEWVNTVILKHHYFNAMAAHNHAQTLASASKFGLAISYWQVAEQQIKTGQKYQKGTRVDITGLSNKISTTLKMMIKDNDTIYHEIVPATIDPVARAPMVRADPPKFEDGEDLLSSLKPIAIRRAYARYQSDVTKLIKQECERLDVQMVTASKTLSTLSMPAALDALTQPQGTPPILIERSTKCASMGGVAGLRAKIDNMKTLSQNNMDILQEAMHILDNEEGDDDAMRNKYIADWPRTPSATLTKELREEARMFRSKLDSAIQADTTVRKKFDENYNIMDTLCHTSDLTTMLPSGGAQSQPDGVKQLVKALRELIANLDAAREAVPALKDMIINTKSKDNIEVKLVEAANSSLDDNAVINDHIKSTYGPVQKQINDNIVLQNKLLSDIKDRATDFQRLAAVNDISRKRETVMKNLCIAYDKFVELSQNLHEGQQFYTDLTNRLLKFQQKCLDFCTARTEELNDYKKKFAAVPAPSRSPPQGPPRPAQPPARPMTTPMQAGMPSPMQAGMPSPMQAGMPSPMQAGMPSPMQTSPVPGFWQPGMPVQYDQGGYAAYPPPNMYGQYAPPGPYNYPTQPQFVQ